MDESTLYNASKHRVL